jgi:hypothetical protein
MFCAQISLLKTTLKTMGVSPWMKASKPSNKYDMLNFKLKEN